MSEYDYVKNNKGHVWATHKDGNIDKFAYEHGDFHNGPMCTLCGYGFCHHCADGIVREICTGKLGGLRRLVTHLEDSIYSVEYNIKQLQKEVNKHG